jgi:hypothetical protein
MAKGKKTGGRRKGSKNALGTIKEAVARCFDDIGGGKAFAIWATEHRTEFYTKIAPRLIPQEITGNKDAPLPLRIELTDGPSPPPDAESSL